MMSLVVLIIVMQSWLSFAFPDQPVVPIAGLVMCVGCMAWFCARQHRRLHFVLAASLCAVFGCAVGWHEAHLHYSPVQSFAGEAAADILFAAVVWGCLGILAAKLVFSSETSRMGLLACGFGSAFVGRTWQLLLTPTVFPLPVGYYMASEAAFVGLLLGVDLVPWLARIKGVGWRVATGVALSLVVFAGMVYAETDSMTGPGYTCSSRILARTGNVEGLIGKLEHGNRWVQGGTDAIRHVFGAGQEIRFAGNRYFQYNERADAAVALGDLKARQAVPALIDAARSDSVGSLRDTSVYALSLIGDRRAVRPLQQMLAGERAPWHARIIAESLDALGSPTDAHANSTVGRRTERGARGSQSR